MSEGGENNAAHFPKKPEFMINSDDVPERKKELEDYLNFVLQNPEFRNLPELLEFLEVSEFSFAQGFCKGKEGIVKKLAGGDQKRTGILKCINRWLRHFWTYFAG